MPRALLTGLSWYESDSDYADPPHWEERWFGNDHWFPRWYHNRIRYGLLHWGPIGWVNVFVRRIREDRGIPRCSGCRRIMWPWLTGYGRGDHLTYCTTCDAAIDARDGIKRYVPK